MYFLNLGMVKVNCFKENFSKEIHSMFVLSSHTNTYQQTTIMLIKY